MKTVDQLIDDVLRHEGGFVNDPDDPGGATNFGITRATLEDWRGRDVSPAEVESMGIAEARAIYRDRYYLKPRIDLLPAELQPSVFDFHVNAGGNAIRCLQRVLNEVAGPVTVDGGLGPQSASAAQRACEGDPQRFVDAYGAERREYYYKIGDKRPRSRKYAQRKNGGKGGWITRAEAFMSHHRHLSDEEHQTRTKEWT